MSTAAALASIPPPSSSSTPGGGGTYSKGAAWSGGGLAIVASSADVVYAEAPADGTIVSATVLGGGGPGSCAIEVWKSTYPGALPTSANKISASAPPTITAASKSKDTTLAGWTTAVAAGDIVGFKLLSASALTWVSVILEITP